MGTFHFTVLLVSICQRSFSIQGIVENIGFEPMTSCVRCKRSSQAELIPRRRRRRDSGLAAQLHLFPKVDTEWRSTGSRGVTNAPLASLRFLTSITVLSRKEVFQPHLPVRLPCYDLAPITSFALGRSLRSRTSGAPGFHGLTGGVYKARERIHRAMADARLLANPASWGRVADPSPN